jgi:hypothetical protein
MQLEAIQANDFTSDLVLKFNSNVTSLNTIVPHLPYTIISNQIDLLDTNTVYSLGESRDGLVFVPLAEPKLHINAMSSDVTDETAEIGFSSNGTTPNLGTCSFTPDLGNVITLPASKLQYGQNSPLSFFVTSPMVDASVCKGNIYWLGFFAAEV